MKIKARGSFSSLLAVGGILVAGCVGDIERAEDTDTETDTGSDTGTGTGTNTGTGTGTKTGTKTGTTSDSDIGCGGGCGGVAPSPPDAQCIDSPMEVSGPVALVVGTHDGTVFTPFVENQKLPLVYGPQGGWHVWVTLRVFAESSETFQQHSRLDAESGVTSAFNTCAPPQWAEMIDIPVFVEDPSLGMKTLLVDVGPVGGGEPTASASLKVEITAE